MGKEKPFQDKVKEFIEACGGQCYVHTPAMYDGTFYGETGVADIIGALPGGYFVALEVKASKNSKATVDQRNFLCRFRSLTHLTFIVYPENFEEVQQIILQTIKDVPIRRKIYLKDYQPPAKSEKGNIPAHAIWKHLRGL